MSESRPITLSQIRGGDEGFAVQMIIDEDDGRLKLRLINEGGFACADVDLLDIVSWLNSLAPGGIDYNVVAAATVAFAASKRSD